MVENWAGKCGVSLATEKPQGTLVRERESFDESARAIFRRPLCGLSLQTSMDGSGG
jgi:hypothetical protein